MANIEIEEVIKRTEELILALRGNDTTDKPHTNSLVGILIRLRHFLDERNAWDVIPNEFRGDGCLTNTISKIVGELHEARSERARAVSDLNAVMVNPYKINSKHLDMVANRLAELFKDIPGLGGRVREKTLAVSLDPDNSLEDHPDAYAAKELARVRKWCKDTSGDTFYSPFPDTRTPKEFVDELIGRIERYEKLYIECRVREEEVECRVREDDLEEYDKYSANEMFRLGMWMYDNKHLFPKEKSWPSKLAPRQIVDRILDELNPE